MSKKIEIWNKLKQSPINMTTKKLLENHSLEYKNATVEQLSTIYDYLTSNVVETVKEIKEEIVNSKEVESENTDENHNSFGMDLFGYSFDCDEVIKESIEENPKNEVESDIDEMRLQLFGKSTFETKPEITKTNKNLPQNNIAAHEVIFEKQNKNITPKKIPITRLFELNEQKITKENQILQERLSTLESDNIIAEIGYICLNDGVHYKGRDSVLIVKHCLQKRMDSLGHQIPPYYNKPIYCLFGQARVKRDSPVIVPISVKDKDGNWVERRVKSDTKPDTAASVRDYMNNGKVESAGYKQATKVQSLTLYPEKFYLNDPRKNLTKGYKTLEKEQELRHIVYSSKKYEDENITVIRSQAFKSNGQLRDFKTPGGYVGATKKTKSKISSGGKSENNTNIQVFDKGTKFTLEKLGVVQLVLNTNSGIIDLIDYKTGKIIIRVGEITQDEKRVYDWKFYKDLGELKPILKNKIEALIRPKQADSKGNINLVQTQIIDGLKQQKIQKVTEERFGHTISNKTISRVRSKAWKYINGLTNKESHPLYVHLKNENWQEVFTICTSLGLISK